MELKHGDKIRCIIDGKLIEEARVSIDDKNYIWICQNEVLSGGSIPEMFGYKYATLYGIVGTATTSTHVTDIAMIEEPKTEDGTKTPAQELLELILKEIPEDKIKTALTILKSLNN